MADEKHLEILREGVEVWNERRKENPDVEPYLFCADLISANLSNADLIGAKLNAVKLSEAKLIGANLSAAKLNAADLVGADLSAAKLNTADLSNANLIGAKLTRIQALATNFQGAILTSACIEDWNINSQTNLNDVKCDYIYLKGNYSEEEQKWFFSDRRPHDPDKIFAPGEFTKLFQKALETMDLLFQNGVDWQAVAYSLKNIQVLNEDIPLKIQKIEDKGDGDVLISVNVPEGANKGEIEGDFWQGYEFAHKALEGQYQARLDDKDKEINRLFYIVIQQRELIGDRNIQGNYYEQSGEFGIGHNNQSDISAHAKITSKINEAAHSNLTQAAEIQQLLDHLQKTNGVTLETAQQQVAKDLATKAQSDTTLKERLIQLGKFISENSAKIIVSEGVKGVIKLFLLMV